MFLSRLKSLDVMAAENFVYQPQNKKAAPLARGGLGCV
jgi:hypothetical protein